MLTMLICSLFFFNLVRNKSGKSKVTRRRKQKEEIESGTEEETEADTEEETEADTEEEEDSDAEEEGDSDAEDGGPRRAMRRPLEVAEEDYAKPNKWALQQLCVLKHVFECWL